MTEKNKHQKVSHQMPTELPFLAATPLILSNIIKMLPGCVYWKDLQGKYLGCNNTLLEMAGMKSVLGKTDFDMPWIGSAETIRTNDLRGIALNSPLELEEIVTLADGQQVTVLTKKAPLRDEQGNVIGIIGVSLNITHRKQREEHLLSSQEKTQSTLENIIAHMPGHVYWKDKHGVYQGCNNRQAQSAGLQFGYEVIGKTDFDLPWGKEQAALIRHNDRQIMETGETEVIEEFIQIQGREAIFLSHKSPIRNKQSEIIGILGMSVDITERKKIEAELNIAKEKAETANRAKTEFLENMRHDIRTPLTGIVGFAELIKIEAQSTHLKEYAENLMASSHALLHFMDEILEAIRVSSGELPRVKKKFSLHKILQHVIDLNKAKACAKHLDFLFDFDPLIPKYLIGDSIRIHRIILELITNSLNFTDSGLVKLSATLAKQEGREVVLKFSVEDSGIGIPQEKQQEIFLHFKRLTPSFQGIYKGAGLGLAVIKQFVDELGGEIYVKSSASQGTLFTCIIPLKVALLEDESGVDEDFSMQEPKTTSLSQQTDTPMYPHRILVVEDNPAAQIVAQKFLSQCHCEVDIAINGQAALSYWQQNKYDLIFMDLGLPDMDGYQVTQLIRMQELAKNCYTPIIALSAHTDEKNKQRCMEFDMDAVLSKPLTPQNCLDILTTFLPAKNAVFFHAAAQFFELSTFPILDIQEGIKTIGTEKTLYEMLKLLLEHSLNEDSSMLKKAHAQGNWEEVQRFAHKIKGGAIYVGAVRMKIACQYLELCYKKGQTELLEQLYQQVLQVIDASQIAISTWIKEQTYQ